MSESHSVFSPEQLICLRNQIMVFRTLKVNLSMASLSLEPLISMPQGVFCASEQSKCLQAPCFPRADAVSFAMWGSCEACTGMM